MAGLAALLLAQLAVVVALPGSAQAVDDMAILVLSTAPNACDWEFVSLSAPSFYGPPVFPHNIYGNESVSYTAARGDWANVTTFEVVYEGFCEGTWRDVHFWGKNPGSIGSADATCWYDYYEPGKPNSTWDPVVGGCGAIHKGSWESLDFEFRIGDAKPTTTSLSVTTPTGSVVGETVVMSATVSGLGSSPAPLGTVTIADNGTPLCTSPAPASAPYTVTCRKTWIGTASTNITASFSGDIKYGASASAATPLTIGAAPTNAPRQASGVDLHAFDDGDPAAFTGVSPSSPMSYPRRLEVSADGRQHVAIGDGGYLYHQLRNPDGTYTGFASLGGAWASDASIATMPDGTAQVVAIGNDNNLWWIGRHGNGTWTSWGVVGNGVEDAAIAGRSDNSSEVVAIGSDGTVQHRARSYPSGTWGSWAQLLTSTGSPLAATRVAIAEDPSGRVHVTAIGIDGKLYHQLRSTAGVWSGFAQLPNLSGTYKDVAMVAPSGSYGEMQVVTVTANGTVRARNRHDTGWTSWITIPQQTGSYAVPTHVAVARDTNPGAEADNTTTYVI